MKRRFTLILRLFFATLTSLTVCFVVMENSGNYAAADFSFSMNVGAELREKDGEKNIVWTAKFTNEYYGELLTKYPGADINFYALKGPAIGESRFKKENSETYKLESALCLKKEDIKFVNEICEFSFSISYPEPSAEKYSTPVYALPYVSITTESGKEFVEYAESDYKANARSVTMLAAEIMASENYKDYTEDFYSDCVTGISAAAIETQNNPEYAETANGEITFGNAYKLQNGFYPALVDGNYCIAKVSGESVKISAESLAFNGGENIRADVFDYSSNVYVNNLFTVTKILKTQSDLKIFEVASKKNDNGYYVLDNDLIPVDGSGEALFIEHNPDAISEGYGFTGTLDGNGHAVNFIAGNGGLFGNFKGATIKNVNFTEISFENEVLGEANPGYHRTVLGIDGSGAKLQDVRIWYLFDGSNAEITTKTSVMYTSCKSCERVVTEIIDLSGENFGGVSFYNYGALAIEEREDTALNDFYICCAVEMPVVCLADNQKYLEKVCYFSNIEEFLTSESGKNFTAAVWKNLRNEYSYLY